MVVTADHKKVDVFSNEVYMVKGVYDFAKDGGAIAVYDLFTANEAIVIHQAFTKVKTAVTSGGAATVEIGIKAGDTDALLAATAPAGLLINTVLDGAAASERLLVAADAIIALEVKVAALTAGKIEVCLVVSKF